MVKTRTKSDSISKGFYVIDSSDSNSKKVSRSIYGRRYPTNFLNARANDANDEQLRDPYNTVAKARFEDAYRSDPIVRRCINLKAKYILGKRPKTILDIVQEYNTSEEARQALSVVMSNQEYQRVKTAIDATNRRVKFHIKLQAALKQSHIGGRSALLIEKLEGGRPADLKILNWKKLGSVHVEKDTWQLQSVDYADNDRNDPLLAEEIIYFAHSDDHISPDTLYYGLSEIEPIQHISECNRLIDEEDAKEINRGLWAGFGLLRFPTNTTDSEMDDFISKFNPGLWSATSQAVTAEVHQIAHDLDKLINERRENDRRIMAALGVPSFLMGFEDITNRACYSEDTQTLTENGWKYWYEIDPQERIATFNPETQKVEYHVPDGLYVYDFKGYMVHFHSKNQDILVTPEHEMWNCNSMNDGKQVWAKRQAKDFMNLSSAYFRSYAEFDEQYEELQQIEIEPVQYKDTYYNNKQIQVKSIKMDTWLEFLGYFISEGIKGLYKGSWITAISQNVKANPIESEKIEQCIQYLKQQGFNTFNSYIDKDGTKRWQCWNKQLYNALAGTGDKSITRQIPRWILNQCSTRQLRILFNALMVGDGTYTEQGQPVYCTTSPQLADDVQELAMKLGYSAKVSITQDKRPCKTIERRAPLYRVSINTRPTITRVTSNNNQNIEYKPYQGKVYCYHVPNHLFITRRNGKPTIQGNTSEAILLAWKESDLEDERTWLRNVLEPQWYDSLLMIELGITDLSTAEIKVKQAFEDITFETLEEKSAAVLPLYKEGIIPLEKVLELLDMDDVVEQVKMEKEKQDRLAEERLNIERMKARNPALQLQQQQQRNTIGNRDTALDEPQLVAMLKAKQIEKEAKQKKKELDNKRLEMLMQLQKDINNHLKK